MRKFFHPFLILFFNVVKLTLSSLKTLTGFRNADLLACEAPDNV